MAEKKGEIETPLLDFAEKVTSKILQTSFSILKGVVKEAKKALKNA